MELCRRTIILGFFFDTILGQESFTTNDQPVGNPERDEDPIKALGLVIPGVAGEDYPIYPQPPETSFSCIGQVNGGYYADPEAQCQSFHICGGESLGFLNKFSFLCPNGTLFQQQYFVCDWWFNVDCSKTEELYTLNSEIEAAREAASLSAAGRKSTGLTDLQLPSDKNTKRIPGKKSSPKFNEVNPPSINYLKKVTEIGKKANGRKGNKRKGSGLRKGGSSSRKNDESSSRSKSVSGSKPASSQGDIEFPIGDLPSVELPSENDFDRETTTPSDTGSPSLPFNPIETLYGAPAESVRPIEEQIFRFDAEIPPANSQL